MAKLQYRATKTCPNVFFPLWQNYNTEQLKTCQHSFFPVQSFSFSLKKNRDQRKLIDVNNINSLTPDYIFTNRIFLTETHKPLRFAFLVNQINPVLTKEYLDPYKDHQIEL